LKKIPISLGLKAKIAMTRPAVLQPIETCLENIIPRSTKFYHSNGLELENVELERWSAVRAWVVSVKTKKDTEGPTFEIVIAIPGDSNTSCFYIEQGYDTYHWATSYPAHYRWFMKKMVPKSTLTVLVDPNGQQEPCIFGQMEPFERKLFNVLLSEAQQELDIEEKTIRLYAAIDALRAIKEKDPKRICKAFSRHAQDLTDQPNDAFKILASLCTRIRLHQPVLPILTDVSDQFRDAYLLCWAAT